MLTEQMVLNSMPKLISDGSEVFTTCICFNGCFPCLLGFASGPIMDMLHIWFIRLSF